MLFRSRPGVPYDSSPDYLRQACEDSLRRLGVEVIAVDRYANVPAMQVAHRSHVINMLDGAALRV